jgi:flagellar FliL protein
MDEIMTEDACKLRHGIWLGGSKYEGPCSLVGRLESVCVRVRLAVDFTWALDDVDEDGEDKDEEGSSPPSTGGGKKKLFIIIGLVLLLVIGGAAAAYFTGLLQPLIDMMAGEDVTEDEEGNAQTAIFYDLPELLINLNTTGRGSTFLKIRVALELKKPGDVPVVERLIPKIVDNFQVYLRELRVEDLKGSAGMYRLREELLKRVATAIAPVKINDLLFKEMLVQ